MMEFTEKGLILKVGRFREYDLWVRFFSPSRGMLTAFAFGGLKSRKRFCGCLDPMNHVLFKIKSNRTGNYLCLQEGSLVHTYPRLRRDPRRLGPAVNCLKFFEAVHVEPQGAGAAYDLLKDTLEVFEDRDHVSSLFPLLFRAGIAFGQGYAPRLDACFQCGKNITGSAAPYFLVEQGRVRCSSCEPGDGKGLKVSGRTLETLERVRTSPPKDWCTLRPEPEIGRQCFEVVENFVRYHLGLAWENGRFQKI